MDWNEYYNLLLDFKKEHGHVLVPFNYTTTSAMTGMVARLGLWVFQQRRNFKQSHLDKDGNDATSTHPEAKNQNAQ
jgi:Helicase associated domain